MASSVDMTSLTPRQWRSRAAVAAHSPPPAHPASAITGNISQICPVGKNSATPVAVSAPMYSWPSPPTLTKPTRVGMAVANAVNTSGIIVTPTSLRPKELPMTPFHTSRRASAGSCPETSRRMAKTARASATPKAAREADCLKKSSPSRCSEGGTAGWNLRRRFMGFMTTGHGLSSAGRFPVPMRPWRQTPRQHVPGIAPATGR